jgi:hypothetical protein
MSGNSDFSSLHRSDSGAVVVTLAGETLGTNLEDRLLFTKDFINMHRV